MRCDRLERPPGAFRPRADGVAQRIVQVEEDGADGHQTLSSTFSASDFVKSGVAGSLAFRLLVQAFQEPHTRQGAGAESFLAGR